MLVLEMLLWACGLALANEAWDLLAGSRRGSNRLASRRVEGEVGWLLAFAAVCCWMLVIVAPVSRLQVPWKCRPVRMATLWMRDRSS
jgi:hypothetical protein